ncbi:unnamed protein product [Prorocentrum cordatum]|uniref:Fibrous sheath-interacting protein 1 n=1 Tax=Prorocentrum cordatum TaxID=2364126 RepID=A0ABN9R5G0_9DINO|nr:unnamed protein product [Polarella glacialis]
MELSPGGTQKTGARAAAPLEAARGALMAAHAAAGLAVADGRRSAARFLRATEGLLRTAVAELHVPPGAPSPAGATASAEATRRRRRPHGRGGAGAGVAQEQPDALMLTEMGTVVGSDGAAAAAEAAADVQSMLEARAEVKGKGTGKGGELGDKNKHDHLEVWQLRKLVIRLRECAGLPRPASEVPFDHGVLVAMAAELEELAAVSDGTRGGGSGAGDGGMAPDGADVGFPGWAQLEGSLERGSTRLASRMGALGGLEHRSTRCHPEFSGQFRDAVRTNLSPRRDWEESRARFRELDKAQADLRRERKKCEDAIEASRRHNLARQRAEERLRQARRALAAATAGDDPAPEWLQQLVLVLSQDLDDEADALPFSAMSSEAVNMPISDRVDAFAVSASTPEEFFDLGQQVLLEAGGTSAPESRRDSIASDATPELPPDLQGKFYQAATAGSSVATSAACAGEEPPLEEPAPEPLELDVQPWRATTMRSPSALAEGHYESLMAAAGRSPAWQPDSDACQCCKGRRRAPFSALALRSAAALASALAREPGSHGRSCRDLPLPTLPAWTTGSG